MSEVENVLRTEVKKQLSTCSHEVTPVLCHMIQSKEGYLKAEAMVIRYAIQNQVSIGAAIAQLEVELE